MNKRWWIAAVAAVMIAALSLAGCQSVAPRGAGTGESAGTAVVRRGTLLVTVDAANSLAPGSDVSLSFSSSGRVAEVLVEEGQVVEAGQPLARLEPDDLELQVAQAQAALAATEAQLAQSLAPPRSQEVAVQEANLAAARTQLDLLLAGTTAEEMGYPIRTTNSARLPLPVGLQPEAPPLVGRPG
jgi:HlyD family secretion protein